MNAKRFWFVSLALLIMVSGLMTYSIVPTVHADPSLDQGCQCHNNGIGVWFNGTGFNEYGGVTIAAGGTFVLNATSANIAATGVVPGVQQWLSNMSDNAKFTFKPQSVTDTSPQNLQHVKGNITAIYTITAPSSGGSYMLDLYAQGTTVGFSVQATGGSSTTTSTGSSSTGSSSTGSSTSTTNSTSSSQTSTSSNSGSSTTTTTTTKTTKAGPDVTYYSSELALIVVGFSLVLLVVTWRYRKS